MISGKLAEEIGKETRKNQICSNASSFFFLQ